MLRPRLFLVDTSVWIDFFLRGERGYEEARQFFMEAERREIGLLYTATTLKDVFYLIPRRLRTRALSEGDATEVSFAPAAWACVRAMTEIATVAPLSLPECDLAWMLRNKHGDFEDNLVIAAAETCNADYVVTYDRELLEHFPPACITPQQALELLELASPRGEQER